jgi:hypothetical protein
MVTGKVVDGKVVVEGDPLPEGATVTVLLPADDETFELTDEQWAELKEAVAEMDRGQGIPAQEVLAAIRRPKGGTSSR